MKKNKFSYEKHNEVGIKLHEIREYLLTLDCEIADAYPKNSKVFKSSYKVYRAINQLKATLDDCVCGENPDKSDQDVVTVYYRNGRKTDIQSAIDKLPYLNNFGVGLYGIKLTDLKNSIKNGDLSKKARQQLQDDTNELLNSSEQFYKTCEWIDSNVTKIKSINNGHTSYGIKHLAENDIGYITNGVFITAAIHSGFNFKLSDPDSPNVMFNMSEKSIKRLYDRLNNKKN